MSESTEAAPSAEAEAKPAKGGKLMTILALVNFLALLGLGGYFFYTQQHAAAQPKKADDAHGEKKEASEHGEEAKPAHGEEAEEEEKEEEEPASEHGKPAEGHGKPAEGHGKAAEGHGESAGAEDHSAAGGPLLVLEPMVTNLADPDSDRYLKVGLQVRITSDAAQKEVEANLVPVRNQILLYLSSLTIADTSGADNKREIQKRIKRLANEAMPTSRITQVYFTEFVIQ